MNVELMNVVVMGIVVVNQENLTRTMFAITRLLNAVYPIPVERVNVTQKKT